jgi:hypothetical protein
MDNGANLDSEEPLERKIHQYIVQILFQQANSHDPMPNPLINSTVPAGAATVYRCLLNLTR